MLERVLQPRTRCALQKTRYQRRRAPIGARPCTVHSAKYTIRNIGCTVYSIQCTAHCTIHSIQCTAYSTQYTVQCILYTECRIHYTVYSTQRAVYSTQYMLHGRRYTAHYTVHTIKALRHTSGAFGAPIPHPSGRQSLF
jgi:hypothetical protein